VNIYPNKITICNKTKGEEMVNVKSYISFINENNSGERKEGPYYAAVQWNEVERGNNPVYCIYPESFKNDAIRCYSWLVDTEIDELRDEYEQERMYDTSLQPTYRDPESEKFYKDFSPDKYGHDPSNLNAEFIGPFMELPKKLREVMPQQAIEDFETYGIYEQ
jgi:hypothetical protein